MIATLGADKTAYKDSLLTPYTTYTYRVYSYNTAGKSITYTNLDSTTTNGVPLLTTLAIDSLSCTSAKSGGIISNSGGASVTARGIVWSTSNTPSIDLATKTNDGVDIGNYKSSMTGLMPGTLYNVWAYATNSKGTAFGNMASFTTLSLALPTISATNAATTITNVTAQSGGSITSDGGAAITARGVCWSTNANPTTANSKTTDSTGIGTFTSALIGLTAGTTYYVRSYATNTVGTVYGTQASFTTTASLFVTIGTQVWTNKNLELTKYRNGDIIPQVTDAITWKNLTTGAWCYYNNDSALYAKYGKLYNWYAVNDPRGLAPVGWHIPTDVEWTILTTYLGGSTVAGGKMKESGTLNWSSPNTGATNESGFTGLPGGSRNSVDASFNSVGKNGGFQCSTLHIIYGSFGLGIFSSQAGVVLGWNTIASGSSVRCIKD